MRDGDYMPGPLVPCAGLTNEQIYQLIKEVGDKIHLLMHPAQLEYVKKRLMEEGKQEHKGG